MAAGAAAAEPGWPPSAPTPAELAATADEFETLLDELRKLSLDIKGKRYEVRLSETKVRGLVVRVDHVTTAIFGPADVRKGAFGVPPLDRNPTRSPIPPKVENLIANDGPAPASIALDWEAIRRAVYEVEWYDREPGDPEAVRVGSAIATASKLTVFGLQVGKTFWFRVRPLRGKRFGEWGEAVARVANV